MNADDKVIADILEKHGEPFAGSVWRVQGRAVIYHAVLERIAATIPVFFERPNIIRAQRDEAVIEVCGTIEATHKQTGEIYTLSAWSIGEALIGVNYRVSGKQAAYVYAMAEKRAKDRVILKLIGLHGMVYSEAEADEFAESAPNRRSAAQVSTGTGEPKDIDPPEQDEEPGLVKNMKETLDKARTINAVTDYMLHKDTQKKLSDLSDHWRDTIRDHAKARLIDLGWPSKKAP